MAKATASLTLSAVRDISSVTWYYLLQASTAAAPSKPTASPPGGSWKDSEPAYTGGDTKSLYVTERTIYTDGTFDYSTPHLSSSYEAAKAAYNKAVAAGEAAELAAELIIGTQTAATGSWTGVSKTITALYDGLMISYWLPVAGSGYATLNLTLKGGNTTGAIACYYGGTTRLTTHYGAGNVIRLVYRSGVKIGTGTYTGWWADANYYSNTSYTQAAAVKAGANGIRGYTLIMKDTDTTWTCLYSDKYKGTATGKTAYTGGLKLGKVEYSAGAGEKTDSGSSSLDTYFNYVEGKTTSSVYDTYPLDLRYSTNCGTTLTATRAVYLVGTVKDDGLFYLDTTTWYTQTIPTSADGKTYIYLGDAYSSYQVWLSGDNPAYQYYDGKFLKIEEVQTAEASATADAALEQAQENTLELTNKVDCASGVETNDFLTNVQSVADILTFAASQINIGSNKTVADEINQLNSAISIDPEAQTIRVGNASGKNFYILLTPTELGFFEAGMRVAYLNNQQLCIRQSVVLDEMNLGRIFGSTDPVTGETGLGQWAWKVHPNSESPSRNNLNLKWIGYEGRMATVTKTFTENGYSNYKSTWTLALTCADRNITAEEQSITLSVPVLTAKYVNSAKTYGEVVLTCNKILINGISAGTFDKVKATSVWDLVKMTSNTVYTVPNDEVNMIAVAASAFFNTSNPTTNKVPITVLADSSSKIRTFQLCSGTSSKGESNSSDKFNVYSVNDGTNDVNWGTVGYVYYKVPPVITTATLAKDTQSGCYKDATTVTVNVSATAKYGGSISTISLTIGNQTVSRTGNGALQIKLNSTGTFTPTIKVTDSRGQSATKSLAPITVEAGMPQIQFSMTRVNSSGNNDDEGTYGLIEAVFNYIDKEWSLSAPTVHVNGNQSPGSIAWYTNRGLTSAVNWNNVASGQTVYAKIGTFDTLSTFQIGIAPKDSHATGTEITHMLASAFYTIDFLAGGHGIAFGRPCTDEGFWCGMTQYNNDDIVFALDPSNTPIDDEISTLISNLGWNVTP